MAKKEQNKGCMIVGARLCQIREALGKTQYRMALDLQLHLPHYKRLESGETDLRMSTLYWIITMLGITYEEFFSGRKVKTKM